MKYKRLITNVLAVMLGVILIAFGTVGVLAAPDDESSGSDESSQSEIIETVPEPETEPQPETEPEPETQPQPETEEPQPETQPVTEAPEPETKPVEEHTQEQINYIDNGSTGTTEFLITPTLPKTVSQKTYSTNYAFGITCWICVGVGVIVILSVLISTKASRKRDTHSV